MIRHPDGTFNVSIQSGHSSTSVGGVPGIENHIPPHLLPLFSDVLNPADVAKPHGLPKTRFD